MLKGKERWEQVLRGRIHANGVGMTAGRSSCVGWMRIGLAVSMRGEEDKAGRER
jgi:hypothetical protein